MSAETPPAAAPVADVLEQRAFSLFVELAGRAYAAGKTEDPKALARQAFALAEAFQRGNLEFNPVALAAATAKAKASVDLTKVELDLGPLKG